MRSYESVEHPGFLHWIPNRQLEPIILSVESILKRLGGFRFVFLGENAVVLAGCIGCQEPKKLFLWSHELSLFALLGAGN